MLYFVHKNSNAHSQSVYRLCVNVWKQQRVCMSNDNEEALALKTADGDRTVVDHVISTLADSVL